MAYFFCGTLGGTIPMKILKSLTNIYKVDSYPIRKDFFRHASRLKFEKRNQYNLMKGIWIYSEGGFADLLMTEINK